MKLFPICLALGFLLTGTYKVRAQDESKTLHFNGDISATNNGFSFIPTFTLGKPATIVNLSAGGDKFGFEPQFRFDLNGLRPWALIFIWRYNIVHTSNFLARLGTHLPSLAFIHQTINVNSVAKDQLISERFIAPELTTSYSVSRNISVGTYYIHGFGLEKTDQTRHTNFLSLRAFINNTHITHLVYFNWNPQFYYLSLDGVDGEFTAQTVTLALNDFPLSVSSTVNKVLHSNIDVKNFNWNVSVIYTFRTELEKK